MLLSGLQAFSPRPALADGLEKKTIAVQYLSAFQKSDQRNAFRVSTPQYNAFLTCEDLVGLQGDTHTRNK